MTPSESLSSSTVLEFDCRGGSPIRPGSGKGWFCVIGMLMVAVANTHNHIDDWVPGILNFVTCCGVTFPIDKSSRSKKGSCCWLVVSISSFYCLLELLLRMKACNKLCNVRLNLSHCPLPSGWYSVVLLLSIPYRWHSLFNRSPSKHFP